MSTSETVRHTHSLIKILPKRKRMRMRMRIGMRMRMNGKRWIEERSKNKRKKEQ